MCTKHFPDLDPAIVRCAACTAEPKKGPKPDNWWITPSSAATVDHSEALLQGIMDGQVCPICFDSRFGIGCACSRNRLGADDLGVTAEFLEQCVEGSDFTEEEAGHIATSVFKRVTRRMELSDEELQDARDGLRAQFGVKSKWLPPRTTEPTHLPI